MPSPNPFFLNTGVRFKGWFLSKQSLNAFSRSLNFCCRTCEGHSFKNEYSSDLFQSVSQKASSWYQSIACFFSNRSKFIARHLFQRNLEEPQYRTSLFSILLLVFSLILYAFRIFCTISKYTKYMLNMQDLRTKRDAIYSLHLHLVFVTKYRK